LLVATIVEVGFVMWSGEVVDWVGLCWTIINTMLVITSANVVNQVPFYSTFVSTFGFTYLIVISKSCKNVSSNDYCCGSSHHASKSVTSFIVNCM
jgi:hypothetical protein